MRLFKKVAIIGVGLIGGSMALAMKKRKITERIVGVSRHKKTLLLARNRGAIDKGSTDINIIRGADLVILATPISTILNLSLRISKIIRPDCIVTDVGSTKQEIASKLGRIFPRYVGSHPLAGSEKRGFINARPDIFQDSLCILTPTKNTDTTVLSKMRRLWAELEAEVLVLSPDTHDKILSFISHLPHIIAFSLIESISNKYLRLVSTRSLKDTTRIAASDSQLWADIFLSNQRNMLSSIAIFEKNLSKIKSAIRRRDKKLLIRILEQAKKKKDSLEKSQIQILPNPK